MQILSAKLSQRRPSRHP